jgi:hypothetical protein
VQAPHKIAFGTGAEDRPLIDLEYLQTFPTGDLPVHADLAEFVHQDGKIFIFRTDLQKVEQHRCFAATQKAGNQKDPAFSRSGHSLVLLPERRLR